MTGENGFRERESEIDFRLEAVEQWRTRHTDDCEAHRSRLWKEVNGMRVEIAKLQTKLIAAVAVAAFVATAITQIAVALVK